jgi:hypothetical protein
LLEAARRRDIDSVLASVWTVRPIRGRPADDTGKTKSAWVQPKAAGLQADQVRKLHRAGVSKSEIARQLQIDHTSARPDSGLTYSPKK